MGLFKHREPEEDTGPLFRQGNFTLHSGAHSSWHVNGNALTPEDWTTLAELVVTALNRHRIVVGKVTGIPQGGLRFAEAIERQLGTLTPGGVLLVVDDVLTTGASFKVYEVNKGAVGVVAFARGRCPDWVHPIFQLADWLAGA